MKGVAQWYCASRSHTTQPVQHSDRSPDTTLTRESSDAVPRADESRCVQNAQSRHSVTSTAGERLNSCTQQPASQPPLSRQPCGPCSQPNRPCRPVPRAPTSTTCASVTQVTALRSLGPILLGSAELSLCCKARNLASMWELRPTAC